MRDLAHNRWLTPPHKQHPLLLLAFWGWLAAMILVACNATPTPEVCTSVCLDPAFESFYEENGGEELLGLPHTPLFRDEASGHMVQYLDRVRLEYDPAQPDVVLIAPLGQWALEGLYDPIAADVPATSPSREFATGYTVQDQFLTFYEANHGELLFGDPISAQLDEGELRVQYFENARLEWHPEAPVGRQIQVGSLGRAHYLYEVYDPVSEPSFSPDDRARVSTAEVTAAVSAPVLYAGDQQVLYVIVESSDRQPVAGLQVELQITQGDLAYTQQLSGETDNLGTLQAVLELRDLTPGEEVRITVFVRYAGDEVVIGKTSVPFTTWW